ncbi:hypothetical protein NUSPORA_00457 [Nucleospora cyclopteri]
MILKIFWLLNAISVDSLEIQKCCKRLYISTCFDNSLYFKNFLPKFFNFEELSYQSLINHYKDIIYKTINIEIVDNSFNEYTFNKEDFTSKVLQSILNINFLKSHFSLYFTAIDCYKRIEIYLFAFLFNKIESIAELDIDDKIFNDLLGNDVINIVLLVQKIMNLKRTIRSRIDLGIFNDTKTFEIISEICTFLLNAKNFMSHKININKLLSESYIQYLTEFNTEINNKNKEMSLEQNTLGIKARNDLSFKKCFELKNILNKKINFDSINFFLEIKDILENVYNTVFIIFKNNFFKLSIDYFVSIYHYYNYIKDVILLKHGELKNDELLKNFYLKNFNLDESELNKANALVMLHQNILGNFVYNFCTKFCELKKKDAYSKNYRNKYIFYSNLITLEKINDDIMNSRCQVEYFTVLQSIIISQCRKAYNHFKKMTFLCYKSFYKDFDFFQIQCFLILRLRAFCLCDHELHKEKNYTFCYVFVYEVISQFELIVKNNDTSTENAYKISFLKIILEKLNESKKILESYKENSMKEQEKLNINNFLLSVLKLNIYLYEYIHMMPENHV